MKLQIRVKLGLISRKPMRVNVLGTIKYMIKTIIVCRKLKKKYIATNNMGTFYTIIRSVT